MLYGVEVAGEATADSLTGRGGVPFDLLDRCCNATKRSRIGFEITAVAIAPLLAFVRVEFFE
jgi:hypothetical protein